MRFRQRWHSEAGYRDFLLVAIPLILSTSSWTIQHFVDRMFLTWYSTDAIGAAMASGILHYSIVVFFFGTAGYVNSFVAQYVGAGQNSRVGPIIWQGLYLCVVGGLFSIPLIWLSEPLFQLVGHAPELAEMETEYFRILSYSVFFGCCNASLSCFYTGRGKTWTVLWVNVSANAVNLVLDYLLIFGVGGFPALGIAGAAWATNAGQAVMTGLYLLLLAQNKYRKEYATFSGWRFDWQLFKRYLRYGVPSGVQVALDIMSWSMFILLIGRIGKNELSISSMAFNINMLAFMPMIGCGITVSTMVGQYLGRDRPDLAEKINWSAFHITFIYMALFSLAYLFLPDLFLAPFAFKADAETFAVMRPMGIVILRFMAFYSIFDTMNVIFSGTLKGAGDTRFILFAVVGLGWALMVLPIYVACQLLGYGVFVAWGFATCFITVLGFSFLARIRGGKWKTMRVIEREQTHPVIPAPESPATEVL